MLDNNKSNKIEKNNENIEKKIIKNISNNTISDFYSSISYNFEIYDDKNIYNKLSNKIVFDIMKYVNENFVDKIIDQEITSYISDLLFSNDNIINIFNSSIYDFYYTINNNSNFNEESYLTYISILDYINNKFKKELFDTFNLDINNLCITYKNNVINIIDNIIENSVSNIVNSKLNIYDSLIEKEQLLKAFSI